MPSPPPDGPDVDVSAGDAVLRGVALFPLAGATLFPGAILPLHVFEPRYRRMTADVLERARADTADDDEAAAPALVCPCRVVPGFDPSDGDAPPVFEVACVGQIVRCERLADGRYNFLLQGRARVRIGGEYPVGDDDDSGEKPYRRADLHAIPADPKAYEIDLADARERLASILTRPPLNDLPAGKQLAKLLAGPAPTVQIADILAHELVEEADDRQALLEEADERRRVEHLAELLDAAVPDPASLRGLSKRFDADEDE